MFRQQFHDKIRITKILNYVLDEIWEQTALELRPFPPKIKKLRIVPYETRCILQDKTTAQILVAKVLAKLLAVMQQSVYVYNSYLEQMKFQSFPIPLGLLYLLTTNTLTRFTLMRLIRQTSSSKYRPYTRRLCVPTLAAPCHSRCSHNTSYPDWRIIKNKQKQKW